MLILFYSFIQLTFAMCEFPHNPPVYCLKGEIISSKKSETAPFKCFYQVKSRLMIRPSNSWVLNKKLEKKIYKSPKNFKYKSIEVYSKKKCTQTRDFKSIIRYNCSDKYPKIKDLALYSLDSWNREVKENWEEKNYSINCNKLVNLIK